MSEQHAELLSEEVLSPEVVETAPEIEVQALPGEQLRAAREALGISLAEVSAALKFGVRQLEALENNDFSSLTGATFVRGFVRSYARFLKLDEVPLLAMLESRMPVAVVDVRPVETMGAAMPVAGQSSYGKPILVSLGVAALAAACWFGWETYQAQDKSGAATVSAPESKTPTASVALSTQAPSQLALPEKAILSAEEAPSAVPTPALPATSVPLAPTVASSAPAPAPDERLLSFQFGDTSWIEVRDAKQRVIFTGKYPANTQQAVRGKPPFQLVIGNAATVKLRYEDRNIDLQPYIRAEVARLTLDDNSN